MKKYILLLFILGYYACFAQQPVTAYDSVVYKYIMKNNISRYRLYRSNSVMLKGSQINMMNGFIKCPVNNCWSYFIDEIPDANWEH